MEYVLGSTDPDPSRKLRLLIANVLFENRESHKLLALIERTRPDIVLTMETNAFWAHELARLDRDFPFTLKHPQDNAYGMMLFSRLELRDAEIRFLMDEDVPSFRTRVVLRSGEAVWLYAVHPRPPHTFQASFDRDAELLVVGREIRRSPEPTIVAGDLNDVAWSYTTRLFQRIRDRLRSLPDAGRTELRARRRGRAGGALAHAGRPGHRPAHDPRGAPALAGARRRRSGQSSVRTCQSSGK